MSFDTMNLAPTILKAVNLCGYTSPTPIQEQGSPRHGRKDLIASRRRARARQRHSCCRRSSASPSPRPPRARVPASSFSRDRRLANQITEAVRTLWKFMRLRTGAILGGMPYFEQAAAPGPAVDIIVATPGRLIDHPRIGPHQHARVELLVLDEADRMLDMASARP